MDSAASAAENFRGASPFTAGGFAPRNPMCLSDHPSGVSVRQRPFFPAGFCFGSLIGFPEFDT
ncbi:MAG: hypothetical protein DYH17_15595 [Xanthomonadales bacterium PRO6]|nr:hypothetical protein [Anaerolineae bacterium]MCE7932783.1 hypothetical protein [Xanthomonadales bacterium PRO6]